MTAIARIERGEAPLIEISDPMQALFACMGGCLAMRRLPTFPAIYRLVNSELHSFPDLAAFYVSEVIERAQRLLCEMFERAMARGQLRRMDPLVAARMLSALFITHALWYHQRDYFKSFKNEASCDEMLAQIRDFFLHAVRPALP